MLLLARQFEASEKNIPASQVIVEHSNTNHTTHKDHQQSNNDHHVFVNPLGYNDMSHDHSMMRQQIPTIGTAQIMPPFNNMMIPQQPIYQQQYFDPSQAIPQIDPQLIGYNAMHQSFPYQQNQQFDNYSNNARFNDRRNDNRLNSANRIHPRYNNYRGNSNYRGNNNYQANNYQANKPYHRPIYGDDRH